MRVLPGIVLAVALAAPALPARGADLVTGAIRDTDGRPVAAARVAAVDPGGRDVAATLSDPGGTFALDVPDVARLVRITPRYGEAITRTLVRGEPLIVIVRCYRAAFDRDPSAADVAALPNGSATALAAVIPGSVTFPATWSDRYLGRGRGAVLVDGIPFYRRIDGSDALAVLPSRAAGALGTSSPLDAPRYGDRAAGGVLNVDPFEGETLRLDARDAALRSRLGTARIAAALSADPDPRAFAALRAGEDERGLQFDLTAGGTRTGRLAGASAQFARSGRRGDLVLRADAAADDANSGGTLAAGRSAGGSLALRGRGVVVPDLALRVRFESGMRGDAAGRDGDAALVAGLSYDDGRTQARAALAAQRTNLRTYESQNASAGALLPSLAVERVLDERWSVHAGAGTATLAGGYLGGDPLDRSTLTEATVRYGDGHRLRAELGAFGEQIAGTIPTSAHGYLATAGWQIAPAIGIRAWRALTGDRADGTGGAPYSAVYGPVAPGRPRTFRRDVVWLTYERATRIDLLTRNGALEAALRAPLGAKTQLIVATYRRDDATRVTTVGIGLP